MIAALSVAGQKSCMPLREPFRTNEGTPLGLGRCTVEEPAPGEAVLAPIHQRNSAGWEWRVRAGLTPYRLRERLSSSGARLIFRRWPNRAD